VGVSAHSDAVSRPGGESTEAGWTIGGDARAATLPPGSSAARGAMAVRSHHQGLGGRVHLARRDGVVRTCRVRA